MTNDNKNFMFNKEKIIKTAREVVNIEAKTISSLYDRIDEQFALACELILSRKGRIAVTGMGKSSHIASKIAATLSSTGSPAFFVHPGEASHGDIGGIIGTDIVLAISNSGNTPEIISIIPSIKRLNIPIISLTGNKNSILAREANINIDISVDKEACPMGLVPTSSTTAALVIGDAIAIALLEARGFTANDFALSHPGGILGKRLILKVDNIMHSDKDVPKVTKNSSLESALIEITQKKLGITTIVDNNDKLIGIFTDGDLRRTLSKKVDIHTTIICEIMTSNCKTITLGTLAIDALRIMEKHSITSLVVTDESNHVMGVIHIHDILKTGLT